jgi:hypothetical protein
MEWTKDEVTGEHQLEVKKIGYYAVVPTVAGDWYAGFSKFGDLCLEQESGNDVEYFDTWQAARKWCEAKARHDLLVYEADQAEMERFDYTNKYDR